MSAYFGLRRLLRQEHQRGHDDALAHPDWPSDPCLVSVDYGIPVQPYARWAYDAGWREGQQEARLTQVTP